MKKFFNIITWPLRMLMTVLILTLLYFLVIGPISVIGRIFGQDFLGVRKKYVFTYWLPYEEKEPTIENFKKPY